MEEFDRALAREATRLDPRRTAAPVVRTQADIKRLVAELDPVLQAASPTVELSTTVDTPDGAVQVTVPTRSRSKREMLVDAMDQLVKRQEARTNRPPVEPVMVNGKPLAPAAIPDGLDGRSWADAMIKQWFGAYRQKHLICWDLPDGYTYSYDVLHHQLTRNQS